MTSTTDFTLSTAQQRHLSPLVLAMQIAAAKLDAARSILQAQLEIAQQEYDEAQAEANTFVRYCGNELQVPFDQGEWDFDVNRMSFLRKEQGDGGLVQPNFAQQEQQVLAPAQAYVNGSEGG